MEVYAYPVPFCLVKNFLNDEKFQKVKSELNELRPHLKGPELTGSAIDQNQLSVKRRGLFLHEHHYLRGNSGINSIFDKVMDPLFIGQLTSKNWIFEYLNNNNQSGTLVSLYEEGDEYKYHKDTSVLSIIYYAFDGDFKGGDFYLGHVKVPIETNSLIIFPSCVPHCVKPITGPGSRWSITTFFNLKPSVPVHENIFKFRNFISPEDWKTLHETIEKGKWSLSGNSDPSKTDPTTCRFWYMDLSTNEFFTQKLFEKIPHGPWKLERVYANGHSVGQDGDFHTDSLNPKCWTFLLYANDIDNDVLNKWGGTTEFETSQGVLSQVPEPNLGILFKSDIFHRGLAPSRYVNALRVTIAWKLTKA